ncbi:MAG TPA: hypothetical protein VFU88_04990 [Ktedonobacterales bacterium]|nr:hypothetical protein [Ktedonobacterales bacterium]
MGDHEAMRNAYYVLFGCIVLFYTAIGIWGIVRLRRLQADQPPAIPRLGYREVPSREVQAALGLAALNVWRRAAAWSDGCGGVAGALFMVLAIPVAVVLPISSPFFLADFVPVWRAGVLLLTGFALSGVGVVLGRCLAIAWITPPGVTPPATVETDPLSRGRRKVTALAIGLWAVDVVVTLVFVWALATTAQTPRAKEYLVPAYMALALMFPFLFGVALAAEMWLGRGWRSLIRSVLAAAPNPPSDMHDRFRSFAGTFMSGRAMTVGFIVLMGQPLLTGQIASFQPYFGSVADVAFICEMILLPIGPLTWALPITSFTVPRAEATPDLPGVLPTN